MLYIKNRRRQRGVGFTEYIILVGLLGVGLMLAVTGFKEELRTTLMGGTKSVESGVTDSMDNDPREEERRRRREDNG